MASTEGGARVLQLRALESESTMQTSTNKAFGVIDRKSLPGKTLVCIATLTLVACGGGAEEAPAGSEPRTGVSADDGSDRESPAAPAPVTQHASTGDASESFSGLDVGGIFLGMTPAQVEAVFQASEPPPTRTQSMRKTYRYQVLGQRMETDPFTSSMISQARDGNTLVTLEAGISPPPDGGRVVAASRSHRQDLERVPRTQYRQALIDKYGAPSYEEEGPRGGISSVLTLTWLLTEGVQCVDLPLSSIMGDSIGDKLRNPRGTMRNPEASSEEDCASFLVYELHEDPVRTAQGLLWDVQADLAAYQATEAWLRELQEDAARPGTELPAL